MRCAQVRGLFGAYWDDETTQAEREWLETHFSACPACRREYDAYSQTLEIAATLPRIEPQPDLVERSLTRARRASAAPDRVPVPRVQWVPATAAAAAVLLLASVISPWIGLRPGLRVAERPAPAESVRQPELVRSTMAPAETAATGTALVARDGALPDSLFDHNEDVEFVLDPVTLRRGRVTTSSPAPAVQGAQAVITF